MGIYFVLPPGRRPADCQSATQQVANLRYVFAAPGFGIRVKPETSHSDAIPPGETRRLYVSQDGRGYSFRADSLKIFLRVSFRQRRIP